MAQAEHPKGALRTGSIADELARPPGILEVVVVSPARPIFRGDAKWVTVAAWDGQLGIWPKHTAIVAALGTGLLRIGQEGGKVARFAVRGGFLKVGGTRVTILVDGAVAEGEADAGAAKKELDEALEALRHPKTDEEFTELLDRRAWGASRASGSPRRRSPSGRGGLVGGQPHRRRDGHPASSGQGSGISCGPKASDAQSLALRLSCRPTAPTITDGHAYPLSICLAG